MSIQLTADEQKAIIRAHRFRTVVTAEGFPDLKKLLQDIEDEALGKLAAYDGDEDHKTAVLAYQWKTAKAVKEKLLSTIAHYIKQGENIALSKVPQEQTAEAEVVAFPGVKPQCDVEAEAAEQTEQP
jgi:hypothetical protein